jgi:hypothetical protein
MGHDTVRAEVCLPATLSQTETEIDVLVSIVKMRVEAPGFGKGITAKQDTGAGNSGEASRLGHRRVIGREAGVGMTREPVVVENETRVLDSAIEEKQLGTDRPRPRVSICIIDERVEPAAMRKCVVIQKNQIRTLRPSRTSITTPSTGAVQVDDLSALSSRAQLHDVDANSRRFRPD